jgi:hypothetical protein
MTMAPMTDPDPSVYSPDADHPQSRTAFQVRRRRRHRHVPRLRRKPARPLSAIMVAIAAVSMIVLTMAIIG